MTKTGTILVEVVDRKGNFLFEKEKLKAHIDGDLHKAFSIFVVNAKSELLIQRRALGKYHSGGLWSNTCCSHPFSGETISNAASRRLQEEMGFDCKLSQLFISQYKFNCGNGLIEHEYNTVFKGFFSGEPAINLSEVCDWKWVALSELSKDLEKKPEQYTSWLPYLLEKFISFN